MVFLMGLSEERTFRSLLEGYIGIYYKYNLIKISISVRNDFRFRIPEFTVLFRNKLINHE
jgi:hypothetical protein